MACTVSGINFKSEKKRARAANNERHRGCNPHPAEFLDEAYYNYLKAAETNPPVRRNRTRVINSYQPQCRIDVDCKGNKRFDPADIDSCADSPKCISDHYLGNDYDMRRRLRYQSINDTKKIGDFNPLKPFNPYFGPVLDYYWRYDDDLA